VETAAAAALKATIVFEGGTGANRLEIINNIFRGSDTHNVTDGIKFVGTNDQVRVASNEMIFSATAGNGLIHITAATNTNLKVMGNILANTMTASTAALLADAVASTGIVSDNYASILTNGAFATTGII
jgi:hypothetical protein